MVTFQLPSGPLNLSPLFPAVNFRLVEEYYLQLRSVEDATIILTTNRFTRGCCCTEDTVVLFFVNTLGGIDSVLMKLKSEETEVRSTSWRKPLKYPLQKWDGGFQRSGISSNEMLRLETTCYTEEDQSFLKEVLASPNAWVQWKGTQGQANDYLPVIIQDGKFMTRKEEERYFYIMEIEVQFSNDNISVRN
jgi:hypothetical protein